MAIITKVRSVVFQNEIMNISPEKGFVDKMPVGHLAIFKRSEESAILIRNQAVFNLVPSLMELGNTEPGNGFLITSQGS
jgi:hypothetical protein